MIITHGKHQRRFHHIENCFCFFSGFFFLLFLYLTGSVVIIMTPERHLKRMFYKKNLPENKKGSFFVSHSVYCSYFQCYDFVLAGSLSLSRSCTLYQLPGCYTGLTFTQTLTIISTSLMQQGFNYEYSP